MPKLVHQLTEPTDETPQGMHINHAPPGQLTELPRVGIERALKIIRNRPFKSVQGLVRVKGIGPKNRPKSLGEYLKEKTGSDASELVDLAPKWSDKSHIIAALKQHLNDTQANLGTDKEDKELVDLGLILDAYRQTQMPSYSDLLKDRLAKFTEYADAPSLGKTASLRELLRNLDSGSSRFVRHILRTGDSGRLSGNCLTFACNLRHALERRRAPVGLVRTKLNKGVAFGVRTPKGDVYHAKIRDPDSTMLRNLLDKERVVKMPEWLAKYTFKKAEEFNRDRDPAGLPYRAVAEALLFNRDGKILSDIKGPPENRYYKFPGGGIDDGEDPETGLRRELIEEVGANPKKLELLEKLDWDWWPEWASSEKQKKRYMDYRGEGSHQFGGLVDELVEPTSEEGDAWEDRPFQDPNKILRHLKKELPALPKEQAPYRELQIRALKEAIKRFSNVKPNR